MHVFRWWQDTRVPRGSPCKRLKERPQPGFKPGIFLLCFGSQFSSVLLIQLLAKWFTPQWVFLWSWNREIGFVQLSVSNMLRSTDQIQLWDPVTLRCHCSIGWLFFFLHVVRTWTRDCQHYCSVSRIGLTVEKQLFLWFYIKEDCLISSCNYSFVSCPNCSLLIVAWWLLFLAPWDGVNNIQEVWNQATGNIFEKDCWVKWVSAMLSNVFKIILLDCHYILIWLLHLYFQ